MIENRPDGARKRRDVIVAVVVSILALAVEVAVTRSMHLHLSLGGGLLLEEGPLVVVLLVLLRRWNWWRDVGWRTPEWRSLWLLWLPALFVALPVMALRYGRRSPLTLAVAFAAAVAVGFTEETWFRGLLFGALRPRGVAFAAFVSSVVFGLFHSSWLVSGATTSATLAEIVSAFAIGLVFAAARVRTRSLWPVVALHAMADFPGLLRTRAEVLAAPAIGRGLLIVVGVAVAYALVLLRPRRPAREPVDGAAGASPSTDAQPKR